MIEVPAEALQPHPHFVVLAFYLLLCGIFTDLAIANQAMSRGKWLAEWVGSDSNHLPT